MSRQISRRAMRLQRVYVYLSNRHD